VTHARIDRLLELMARLRAPDGCPWDREQSFRSIAPYTIEEAYEVDDAIRREEWSDLRDELGDLLLQVVFHAQMAREAGLFDFGDVVDALCDKLVRRHPHVFAGERAADADEVLRQWERHKDAERARRGAAHPLDDVPAALPDGSADALAEQVDGELARAGAERTGTFLFALAARLGARGVDAEEALRAACARFQTRKAADTP